MIRSAPLFRLFYPHLCAGCGSDILENNSFLCHPCYRELPHTNFAASEGNPVEKIFYGRIPIEAAMCEFYFAKHSSIQNLIHEFKYNGNKEVAKFLGNIMGASIRRSNRFDGISAIIPLPLYREREKKRGYNQAELLCRGISEVYEAPVFDKAVIRIKNTESQTKKRRVQRWENVVGGFAIVDEEVIAGKHVLLVDDVITTGATMEACASALLKVPGTRVSVALLAISLM